MIAGSVTPGPCTIAVGTRVRVYSGYGYPSTVATAIVMQYAPYLGRSGYYINWDYGRTREQYESAGGWVAGNMITPVVTADTVTKSQLESLLDGAAISRETVTNAMRYPSNWPTDAEDLQRCVDALNARSAK